MDCRTFSKIRDGCEVVWQASKCIGEVSLRFHLKVNTLLFVSDPTDKNPKDCAEHVDGLYFEICSRMNIDNEHVSFVLCGEIIPEICPSSLDTHCIQNVSPCFIQKVFNLHWTAASVNVLSELIDVDCKNCMKQLYLILVIMTSNSGVPRNFLRGGGFNKFSWGQRTESRGIWGR